jgi:hypothetical protein
MRREAPPQQPNRETYERGFRVEDATELAKLTATKSTKANKIITTATIPTPFAFRRELSHVRCQS